jgi:hypothetical protein
VGTTRPVGLLVPVDMLGEFAFGDVGNLSTLSDHVELPVPGLPSAHDWTTRMTRQHFLVESDFEHRLWEMYMTRQHQEVESDFVHRGG